MTTNYGTNIDLNIQKILGINHTNKNNNPDDLLLAVQNGFPLSVYEAVKKEIELTQNQMSSILGISVRTIARRKENNRFNATESDLLYRAARVLAYTVTVFGDIKKARVWLKRQNRGLGGEIPLNLLGTDIGSQQVEDVLHRINYGIYS